MGMGTRLQGTGGNLIQKTSHHIIRSGLSVEGEGGGGSSNTNNGQPGEHLQHVLRLELLSNMFCKVAWAGNRRSTTASTTTS